ncbi:MAG: inositol monophosphatase [Myxococcota bacterium]|nr:inositol monophosphatase [Myxococcota bacterium]MDW8361201.1 inositol monophosphatase [Myxococcales bacterium]
MKEVGFDLGLLGGRRVWSGLIDAVCAAGDRALALQRAGAARRARSKADRSPVTEADEAVERMLAEYVARRCPQAGFVGEETGARGARRRLRFVVDPIDGTRAFVRDLPGWSILVGVELDTRPVAGVALMPARGDLFVGVVGEGASCNGRPVRLSRTRRLDRAAVGHGGLAQFVEVGATGLLEVLGRATWLQRGFGDFDGYRMLLLGHLDALVEPAVRRWDLSAPAALLRAAGGRLTAADGSDDLDAGWSVASNGPLHRPLLELLRSRTPGAEYSKRNRRPPLALHEGIEPGGGRPPGSR